MWSAEGNRASKTLTRRSATYNRIWIRAHTLPADDLLNPLGVGTNSVHVTVQRCERGRWAEVALARTRRGLWICHGMVLDSDCTRTWTGHGYGQFAATDVSRTGRGQVAAIVSSRAERGHVCGEVADVDQARTRTNCGRGRGLTAGTD